MCETVCLNVLSDCLGVNTLSGFLDYLSGCPHSLSSRINCLSGVPDNLSTYLRILDSLSSCPDGNIRREKIFNYITNWRVSVKKLMRKYTPQMGLCVQITGKVIILFPNIAKKKSKLLGTIIAISHGQKQEPCSFLSKRAQARARISCRQHC